LLIMRFEATFQLAKPGKKCKNKEIQIKREELNSKKRIEGR
jgi:hypothetical protein